MRCPASTSTSRYGRCAGCRHLLTAAAGDSDDASEQATGRGRVEEFLLESSHRYSPSQVDNLARHLLSVLDPAGTDRFDPESDSMGAQHVLDRRRHAAQRLDRQLRLATPDDPQPDDP